MAIAPFLAMTAAEIRANPDLSSPIGWMACHFSPYGTGLSNLPEQLPEGSLLILNDRTPWHRHDPERITAQLEECLERFRCSGLLLDFQRPGVPEVSELAQLLAARLECPVGVSEAYAAALPCPVFLPPVPLHQTLDDHLAPWQNREVWLELALDAEEILLTPEGPVILPISCPDPSQLPHPDAALHCRYAILPEDNAARFSLSRSREDVNSLLEEAENFGVTTAVGLWQELHFLCSDGS